MCVCEGECVFVRVCVCACVSAYVRACMRACVCVMQGDGWSLIM